MARLELRDWIALAGAGVGLALLLRQLQAAPAAAGGPAALADTTTTTSWNNRAMSRYEVEQLIARTLREHPLEASPAMLLSMAWIESSFRPGVIGDDGDSFGLMQVARRTATWLAGEMGFSAFGLTLTDADLLRPEVSMYLGAAYVQWLGRYRGIAREEAWIVRGYNGGPQWETRGAGVLADTARHLARYVEAKQMLGLA